MIACLSPSDSYAEENVSTLNYATKASHIQNQPNKNVDPKLKLIQELKEKVRSLEEEIGGLQGHIHMLTEIIEGRGQQIPKSAIQQSLNTTASEEEETKSNSTGLSFTDKNRSKPVGASKKAMAESVAQNQEQAGS